MSRPDPSEVPTPPNPPAPTRSGSTPIEAGKLIYKPASWFERFDPTRMFQRTAPLEVELGSGDGSFLVEWARLHPDRDFIGVERLLGRARKLDRKAQRGGLRNILGVRIEAAYCVEFLLPTASVSAIHIYFPDPWPKRRHHKNRLVNERFATLVRDALTSTGVVHMRTDNVEYFTQMRASFDVCPGLRPVPTPDELAAVTTDFERGFLAQGIPTNRASYARS